MPPHPPKRLTKSGVTTQLATQVHRVQIVRKITMTLVFAVAVTVCLLVPEFVTGQSGERSQQIGGNAPGTTTTAPLPQPAWIPPTIDSDTLRTRLEDAFRSDPSLANSNIHVTVDAARIGLAGSVPGRRERLTAERIARSFDGNRRIANDLSTVAVKSENTGERGSKPSAETSPKGRSSDILPLPPATSYPAHEPRAGEQNANRR